MELEEIKAILSASEFNIVNENRLPNDTGTQLKIDNGAIVSCYDKGTHLVQGKNSDAIKALLDSPATSKSSLSKKSVKTKALLNKVFVVYGHDSAARDKLEAMLRRWRIEPIILDQIPSEGQTIIEKLERYTSDVKFAIVLATPDDEGHKAGHQDEKAYRARQNVVLELGMMLARLGRKRVAILLNQSENMERPSDIQGLLYLPFKDDLQKDAGTLLAKEMNAQGYTIEVKDL